MDPPRIGDMQASIGQRPFFAGLTTLMRGVLILAVLAAGTIAQTKPTPVVVAPIIEAAGGSSQFFVATIMPLQRAVVGSAIDGRVTEFSVNEGDRVESGQILAQLLTETMTLELESARHELALRQAELEELLNGERVEVQEQARARRDAARATLAYAQTRRDRMERLFEKGNAVSRDEFEQDRSLAEAAAELLKEREAEFRLATTGARPETIAQARARVGMQAANVARLEDQIKKHSVITRFSGYVVAEYTEVGQWVSRGDPVAEVASLDVVEIEAFVPESHIPHVRVGSRVRVEVPALGRSDFVGEVARIVPQADARTRTFPVKVRVTNEITESGPVLKAGMMARVELSTSAAKDHILLVPKDGLVLGGLQPRICLVVQALGDGQTTLQARFIEVEVGQADGDLVEIRGNCQAGDLVVVRGNERLRPGQELSIAQQLETPLRGDASQTPATGSGAPSLGN